MSPLDISIVLAFIVYAIWSGFRAKKKASQNLEEYFLAGRSLSGWKAGISMAATQFASDTPLLVTGLIATAGIFSLWRLWIYALSFLLLGFVLAPSWRKAKVLTDAEFSELRYSGKPAAFLRGFKAIYFGTIFNCTVLAMVLLAATRIAEPFLLWNEWLPSFLFTPVVLFLKFINLPLTITTTHPDIVWILSANNFISIAVIVLVTVFYSTTGGLRSVVQTDLLQFGIMMAGTFFFALIVIQEGGGLSSITEKIPKHLLTFTPSGAKETGLALFTVIGLQWLVQINADGTGYLAQRTMACKSDKDARLAAIVFSFAQIFFRSLLWIPIGLGLLVIFPGEMTIAERESTYILGMAELLPSGLKGLMITGMLAALASTVDTHLNWGSSYWTNDIYKRFICPHILKKEPSAKSLVNVARLSNVLILLVALFITTQLTSIQAAWQTSLLLGAGVGVMLVLRWLWWRVNAWGETASVLTSLIAAPLLLITIPSEQEAVRLLLMAVTATTSGIVVSLLTPPENMQKLKEFYERAHPPGFWSPFSGKKGIGELKKGLLAMSSCTLSLFCLLVGFGSWMVGSLPLLWILGLIIGGLALVPFWSLRCNFNN